MKANELRIGNYVMFQGLNRPFRVSIIDTTETETETKAMPIPLTEDWLLKFGFDKSDNDLYKLLLMKNDDFQSDLWARSESGLKISLTCSQGDYPEQTTFTFDYLKYVHQLQNLYFALTGRELIIKEI